MSFLSKTSPEWEIKSSVAVLPLWVNLLCTLAHAHRGREDLGALLPPKHTLPLGSAQPWGSPWITSLFIYSAAAMQSSSAMIRLVHM